MRICPDRPSHRWLTPTLALALVAAGCPSESDGGATGSSTAAQEGAAKKKKEKKAPDVAKHDEVELSTEGLEGIKARGTLRILTQRSGEGFLPRTGTPALRDVELTGEFAESLGVEPIYVVIEDFSQLIPALKEGKGDLIAAQLTVTKERAEQVDFSRSTFGVSEMLVGKKGAAHLPRKVEDLKGRTVHVRKSSAYAESLRALKKEHDLEDLTIADVPETEDGEDIVYSVTQGERALTVIDSHELDAIETYNPDFERLFPIADKRRIAWAVRKKNDDLESAMNDWMLQRSLTEHRKATFTGDLKGIKERKVIRVLTRNNPITYFLHKGRQFGFDYRMAELIAEDLDVRLEMVVPPSRGDLIPWLLEGKGDMIAASMTVTDTRDDKVAFSRPYLFVDEVLVQKKGAEGPAALSALAGQPVHVRKSSSYYETLKGLQASGVKVKIVEVAEEIETEELIKQVGEGKIDYTVADDNILDVEIAYGIEVESAFPLAPRPEGAADDADTKGSNDVAFAVRPDAKALKAYLDGFVKKNYRGLHYNIAKKRYFENTRSIQAVQAARVGATGQISPYDDVIKRYSKQYGLDWRLMAAQAYVESRFDPNAKSWVGAIGLFQVMPRTGKSLGFTNLKDPRVGTHAGIKYMARLISRFDPKIPLKDRVRLALASYNAGLGHVYDAQRLAAKKGWDPNRWFGNVEKAMLLLAEKEYARQARHGYCRGGEPVKYVGHIQQLYDAYVEVAER